MLSIFRRLIYSKVGLVVAFVLFAIFGLAMVGGDVSSLRTQGLAALGGGSGDAIRVGRVRVSPDELAQRVQQEFDGFRQQQPTLTLQQYIAGGGFDATVERLVNSLALDQYGQNQGMLVSKRAVDGQIASIPGLQGPDGKFDESAFRQLLQQRKLTERGVRADLSRDMMAQSLTAPIERPQTVPVQLAMPYADLSLERRTATIAFVPTRAMATGGAPTDAELQAFYGRNLPRYTLPERRTLRYARVTPALVKARATPSDADIANAYRADAAKYAATEKRSITQVVVLTEAGATALAAKVKAGTPLAAAASAAGLSTSTQLGLTRAALAQSSPALAAAVFAAAQGATVGPVRGPLGFVVTRVDRVEQVAGKSLAQAHDEIATALTAQRTTAALNAIHDQVDDALAGSATFDEIVRDRALSAQTSAALLPSGIDPEHPAAPDATLTPLVAAAFQMQDGDEPQMVPTGPDGSFALVALGQVVHAAPRPLAQLRDQVTRDLLADRARQAARVAATQILARVNGGVTIQQAWAQAGISAEGPKPLAASREDVDRAQGPGKAPLALMFAMAPGTAKLLEAPGGGGWAIIRLEHVQPGDASHDVARIGAIRQAFGQLIGREYAEQFARAARAAVGVTTNRAVIAKVKAQLLGGNAGN